MDSVELVAEYYRWRDSMKEFNRVLSEKKKARLNDWITAGIEHSTLQDLLNQEMERGRLEIGEICPGPPPYSLYQKTNRGEVELHLLQKSLDESPGLSQEEVKETQTVLDMICKLSFDQRQELRRLLGKLLELEQLDNWIKGRKSRKEWTVEKGKDKFIWRNKKTGENFPFFEK